MTKKKIDYLEERLESHVDVFQSADDITAWHERFTENLEALCGYIEDDFDGMTSSIKGFENIIDSALSLHQKGGQCFTLTKKMFSQYASWAYLEKIRRIAYSNTNFTDNVNSADGGDRIDYHKDPLDTDYASFYLSQADIYALLDASEQGDYSGRALTHFMESKKLPLTAALVYLMDRTIYIMSESEAATSESKELAKFLKNAYMVSPDEGSDIKERMKRTGYKSKSGYLYALDRAISFTSKMIFGFIPASGIIERQAEAKNVNKDKPVISEVNNIKEEAE